MGNFGTLDGHVDCLDCIGCLMTMMAMSRLPEGYEDGRFHLLALGVYVWLDFRALYTPPPIPTRLLLDRTRTWTNFLLADHHTNFVSQS